MTVGLRKQRGYLLVTVVMGLFLLAAIAVTLNYDSAISANTSSKELETARADYVAQAGLQNALWRAQNNACMGEVTIPNTPLGADTYSATIKGAAAGTLYKLAADQDAWIRSDDVTRNNGTTVTNHIRQESGNIEQVLTRFDVSTLPAGAQINSAIAWFHLKALKPHPQGAINVHEITADWAEAAVTWESFAGSYRGERIAMLPTQDAGDVWVAINLTGLVQAWANGQPNYGILFESLAEGIHTEYTAREDGTNPPRLEVVVGSGAASPVTIKAKGELHNGVSRELKDKVAMTYQPPASAVLEPIGDVYLKQDSATRNYGASSDLWIEDPGGGGQADTSLIRFNLGLIPRGARVTSAMLEVYSYGDISSGPGSSIGVHRVTRDWVEGTNDGSTGSGASWNESEPGTSWSSAGGDYDPTAIAIVDAPPSTTGWHQWDVTALANDWSTGAYPNQGLALVAANDTTLKGFRSRDYSNSSERPRLTVTYACECGNACMAPQGSGRVLMVVINSFSMTAEEKKKKAMLESWGYQATPISQWDVSWNYENLAANNDVAFVASSVSDTYYGVASGLAASSIGVVSEKGKLNDDLGVSTAKANPTGSSISIVDNSHYITRLFPSGDIPIYLADMEGLTVSGTEAPGLQTLANFGAAGGLVVLDIGTTTSNGDTTSIRKVMLPFGRDNEANFNWDLLNGNGRLLVQRSLAWAGAMGKTTIGNVLLVVGDAANPSARDLGKKSQMESWNYNVTLIDDDADELKFKTEMQTTNVVYVSGSVTTTAIVLKLREYPTGLVNEEADLMADYGFSENEGYNTTFSTLNTSNPHYINEPFGGSDVIAFYSNVAMYNPNGTMSEDLAHVGMIFNAVTSLAALDEGARDWTGTPVPARRVMVPFENADIGDLTPDGLTLMQRSLEWAAGEGCGQLTPLMLLVVNASTLTAEEADRKSLLESWCYSVSTETASVAQATYDTFASDFDVVYVPASVNYADVGTKLKLQPIGVVAEPSILSPHLGFTSGTSGFTGTNTELTDNGHFITTGLATGTLALTSTATSMRHFVNTMGPGFRTLSVRPAQSDPMIMTLDTGDELLWGGNAPDRRVMLPWGGSSTFNVNDLSAEGQTILKRSLEWAADVGSPPGPIAHWKLDETSGTTAVDSVGGHHGTLVNMDPSTDWVTGQLDGGLSFDGSNDFLDVPHDDSLSLTENMTFSAWINASSFGASYQTIVAKDAGGAASNYYFGTWQQELVFGFFAGGLFREVFTSGLNLQADTWYHVAASFKNATGQILLYVDGAQVQDGSLSFSPSTVSSVLRIGRSPDGERWRGLLDDIRIYDQVLSATDIAELAAAASAGPIAHWRFDETGGNTAIDSVGGNNGQLNGSGTWTTGEINGGLAVDYTDGEDYVIVPNSTGLENVQEGDYTLSAWFRPDSTPPGTNGDYDANYGILIKPGWHTGIFYSNQNRFVFWQHLDGDINIASTSGNTFSPGSFYHVAATVDRAAGLQSLYVNGQLQDTSGFTPGAAAREYGTGTWRIGVANPGASPWGWPADGVLDDVRIYDRVLDASQIASLAAPGSGGGSGGGGGGCSGTFRDEFNARTYSGSDGTLSWTDDWQETGESTDPTGGDIRVDVDVSDYQLQVRDDGQTVWREVDLNEAGSATLSFDYRRQNLSGSNDYVAVEVSYDGGSNWAELDRFIGTATDSSYLPYSKALDSNSLSANTRIRFLTPNSGMGNNNMVWFDNVQISCTP